MPEWAVRGFGAALILLSAGGWGAYEIRQGRRRLKELEAVCALLRYIRENIERFSRPLAQIYASWENPALAETGFLGLLRSSGFAAAVREADWHIPAGEREILEQFGEELGKGFREEQTALCRYTEDRLAEALAAMRNDLPGRERLWRTIPLLAALSLILLLI